MARNLTIAALVAALAPLAAQAADLQVSVTNLTGGIHCTPLLVAAHPAATHPFRTGEAASAALRAMAEGGDISGHQRCRPGLMLPGEPCQVTRGRHPQPDALRSRDKVPAGALVFARTGLDSNVAATSRPSER